jgi:hypothetical protein
LFNILVDIAARTASLESGINQAVVHLEKLSVAAESAKLMLERMFLGISVIGIAENLLHTVQGIEEIGHAAEKANVSVSVFSALNYAAKEVGVSTEALSKSFKFMEKAIADAGDGVAKPSNALEKLGVNLDKLRAMTPDKQFETLAEAISRVKDPADKVQIQLALFGRAGSELAPLFDLGAAGIERLTQKAREMGIVLSTEQTAKATEAAEAIKSMTAAWEALERVLAVGLAPTLVKIADGFRKFFGGATNAEQIANIKAQLKELQPLIQMVTQGGPEIMAGHGAEIDRWDRLNAELVRLTSTSKDAAGTIARNLAVIDDAIGKPQPVDKLAMMEDYMTGLKGHLAGEKIPTNHLDEYYRHLLELYQNDTMKKVEAYETQQVALEELVAQGRMTQDQANQSILEHLDKLIPEIQVRAKLITGHYKTAATDAETYGKQASDALESGFAHFFDGTDRRLGSMVANFAKAMDQILAQAVAHKLMGLIFGEGGGAGFFSGVFSGLGFAGGGDPPVGQVSLVGENGPELFVPRTAGTVVPHNAMAGGLGATTIGSVAPVYNMSGLGLTFEQVTSLMQRNNQNLVETLRNPRLSR